ncbi:MAG: fibronectin type III domain-containing protein [Chloroflexi bacterium]|nr:fibronectin type III domain-containing protein [Chloroflexota bacterium]
MYATFKKIIFAFILALSVLTTGAWQGNQVAFAQDQISAAPETPLYSGLTWNNAGSSVRSITLNAKGESISLSGDTYQAVEQFSTALPQDVLDYYSNEQLAGSGWSSHDAVDLPGGVRKVFYHESGVYFSVEFEICPEKFSATCITVWKSEQSNTANPTPSVASEPGPLATGSFGKNSPANGTGNVNPASVVLSWSAFTPTPDKYSYCIKVDSECAANDPNWTGTFTNTSVTLTNLLYGKTYHWQVKAITCADCTPKIFTYADGGTWWTFTTKLNGVSIVGNAGVGGATLSYTDGTPKTVTADSIGNYSITLPTNWSGTVTPSKTGYTFFPASTTYTNLNVAQTITNYSATAITFNISGNAGVAGATLTYTDGILKTATADGLGDYTFPVSYNWTGTVVPSKLGYIFSPVSKNYSNVLANQTAQNYLTTHITYTISGNAGVAGATLSYVDNGAKTAVADSAGNYSITIPYGWSGTVTPSKSPYYFTPTARDYLNVVANVSAQNYTISIFSDVASTYWAFNYIERFSVAGITSGCSVAPLKYCPETTVTNSQMAVFLVRAIHGVAFVPPAATGTVFTDVSAGSFGAAYIEQLHADGIAVGCNAAGTLFCPNLIVSRSDMAVLLLRSKHGASYVPPAASGTVFTDVTISNPYAPWIEQLVFEGITSGCTTTTYCPGGSVTRAQMAVFFVRTFSLP